MYVFACAGAGKVWVVGGDHSVCMKVKGQLVEVSALMVTMWVLGIELRSSGLVASTFTH